MMMKKDSDIEKEYSIAGFIVRLRRLVDSLESGGQFER